MQRKNIFKVLVIDIVILCGVYGFQLKCPSASQRKMRAKLLCINPATYFCLHDDIRGGFLEDCWRVTLEQPGNITTLNLKSNFDNRPCSYNLYQPRFIPFWTNASTDCIYYKSLCREKGQLEYENGGVNFDRTCTCDYTKDYDFVSTPRNSCFCEPSTEDCSCYRRSKNFGKGHKCSSTISTNSRPVLNIGIQRDSTTTAPTAQLHSTYFNNENFILYTDTRRTLLNAGCVCVLVIIIILMLFSTWMCFFSSKITHNGYKVEQFLNRYVFKPFVISRPPEKVECKEGENYTFEFEISTNKVTCLKGNDDFNKVWIIEKKPSSYVCRLVIPSMTRTDAGLYTIKSKKQFEIQCELDFRPFIKTHLIRSKIMEGLPVTFFCETDGTDIPVDWLKNEKRIDSKDNRFQIYSKDGKHYLTIKETELTDKGTFQINVNNKASEAELIVEEMPKEIKEMPKEDRDEFLASVKQDGTASRVCIRVMLVGETGAGKTSLLKRLLNEEVDIQTINMTDGLNIEVWKCQIDLKTGEWQYFPDQREVDKELVKSSRNKALCGFWDFAGQREFYATHQTFLTSNALYLLVVNSSEIKDKTIKRKLESDFEQIGDYVEFWLDNIHCYAVDEHADESQKLRPPVLLIVTHIDKIPQGEVEKVKACFVRHLDEFLKDKRKRKHIRNDPDVIFVSNTEPQIEGSEPIRIKEYINAFAKESKNANLPVKWLLMEQILTERSRAGEVVISYTDFLSLAKDNQMSSKVDLFLRYEHDIGNIIFFEDLKDWIILDLQWLVDAFRCFLGHKRFLENLEGKYSREIITYLLKQCPKRLFEKKVDFIISIMEKFDIIVKIESKTIDYYVPCMMEVCSVDNVMRTFAGEDEKYISTSCLCIDLEFLPPGLFNHVIVRFIRENIVSDNMILSLYRNIGIFFIQPIKIAIIASHNSIKLQILELVSDRRCYNQLRQQVISILNKISERYGINTSYKLTIECQEGPHYSDNGKIEITQLLRKKEDHEITFKCNYNSREQRCDEMYNSWFGKVRKGKANLFNKHSTDDDEELVHTCEFCSSPRLYFCEICQHDMCRECFDIHQPSNTEPFHNGIENDKFCLERTVDVVDVYRIIDMVVLPHGLLVLVDFSCNVVTYDIDDRKSKTIPFPTPFNRSLHHVSLTVIDNSTVAVLSDEDVYIVDVRRQHIIRNATLQPSCLGIMCFDNMLYVGCSVSDSCSIKVIDVKDLKVQKTIPLSYKPRCLRYGNNGCIYCLTDTRVIVIYDMDLNELFTLEDIIIPPTLTNITVDNDGNALALSNNFDGVIKITSTGKQYQVLFLKNNLQDLDLICLCFQAENRKLFQGNIQTISAYKMQK